jgi:hypothetical protein
MRKPTLFCRANVPFFPMVALALLAVVGICVPAPAQLPAARLNSIFPPGGKSGATVEVTVAGVDLDGATDIRFSAPGITAKPVDESDSETDRKFSVTISPDVAPGNYEARVVGKFGVSDPRGFVVGTLPEINNVPGKNAPAPMALPLNTVANGRCPANAVDEYTLELKQGQRVLVDCAVREIDSRLIPEMTLNSPEGAEVARGRRGELIDYTPASNGTYTLRVHDHLYKGGNDYFYRLTAGTGPHLDSIYPPIGTPGTKSKYALLGRNLPGGTLTPLRAIDGKPLEKLNVEIELPADASAAPKPDSLCVLGPAGAGIDGVAYRLKSDAGLSNPLLIVFAQAPVVLGDSSSRDSTETPRKLSAPCEVVGRFYPHGSRDIYSFDADKGAVYWIEIISTRLGQHTSPELLVQTVGKTVKGVEQLNDVQDMGGPDMQPMGKRGGGASAAFPAPSRDIEYRLEAKEAGIYRLMVRDLFDENRDDATLVYCMLIHQESPDFHLVATAGPAPSVNNNNATLDPNLLPPFLRKGGAAPLRVNVLRQDGFDDAVQVEAQGLPPGVHCSSATVNAGETTATLVLTADENAAAWAGNIHVVGKATVAGKETSHEARIGAVTWAVPPNNNNGERSMTRLSAEMPLAVSADETDGLSFELADTKIQAKPDEKIHLSVKIKRHMEMTGPIKLRADGLPRPINNNGNGKNDPMTVSPGGDSASVDIDLRQQRLSPGVYTFYLVAQTPISYERKKSAAAKSDKNADAGQKKRPGDTPAVFYSQPITLTIVPKK